MVIAIIDDRTFEDNYRMIVEYRRQLKHPAPIYRRGRRSKIEILNARISCDNKTKVKEVVK